MTHPPQPQPLLDSDHDQALNPIHSPLKLPFNQRSIRPRRSAASLRSIPERPSITTGSNQPPLPSVPHTPIIDPATPHPNHFHYSRPSSQSSSLRRYFAPIDDHHHLSPDTILSLNSIPLSRDQRSLSSFRLGSQPISSRHSEGSQYASSSSVWTPSSTTPSSRIGFENIPIGTRTSFASRDSRFTAETDYDEYCFPNLHHQPLPSNHNLDHHNQLNLSLSASWHSAHQPASTSTSTSPSPCSLSTILSPHPSSPNSDPAHPPTIVSLMKLDHDHQLPLRHELVGLGITSDSSVNTVRGSRSPSLSARPSDSWRSPSSLNSRSTRPARSASSSLSNRTTSNPIPLHQPPPSQLTSNPQTPLKHNPQSHSKSLSPNSNSRLASLFIQPLSLGTALNNHQPHSRPNSPPPLSSSIPAPNPPEQIQSSLMAYHGLPYDSAHPSPQTIGRSTPLHLLSNAPRASSTTDLASDERIHSSSTYPPSLTDASNDSKHSFYQHHHSNWDDLDDQSPPMNGPPQLPSQALVLAEEGRGRIIDISTSPCSLEKLQVPDDTTHLLLAKTQSPFVMGALLASRLSSVAFTLVALDISDACLNSLPASLSSCLVLEELNVSGNLMASGELPGFLSNLAALKVLVADRCGLYHIAYSYGGLLNLRDLSVRHNHLKSLPTWLLALQRLELLLLDGNEFEPPWLELVEPLLSANLPPNYYSRIEFHQQGASSTASSECADLHSLNPSLGSPTAPPFGSFRSGLAPDSATSSLTGTSEDIRRPVAIERPSWGRQHLGRGSELLWADPGSAVVHSMSDQLEASPSDVRPDSFYSVDCQPSVLPERRTSYLRRLRSTSDMRSRSLSRPVSVHEPSGLSLASLMDVETEPRQVPQTAASTPMIDFKPTSSLSQLLRRPSSSAGNNQALLSPSSKKDGMLSSPPGRVESKLASMFDGGHNSGPGREQAKKSFGFLKKMSLGKLRREPPRSRTASIDAQGRSSGPPSKLLLNSATGLVVPDSPKLVVSDRLMSNPAEEARRAAGEMNGKAGGDWAVATEPVTRKANNRRSFLRLEPHMVASTSPGPGQLRRPETVLEHGSLGHPDGPVEELCQPAPSALGGPGKKDSAPALRAKSRAGTLSNVPGPDPWAGLRSIMMYLRDVHDLSGDPGRLGGATTAGGARPMVGPVTVSRASSTTAAPQTHSLNSSLHGGEFGRPNGMATVIGPGTTEMESETLDSPLSNGSGGATGTPQAESTTVKVQDNAKRRLNVIEEIVATEKSYIRGLKELQEIYIVGASMMVSSSIGKEKEPVVPATERKIVFNNVEAIIGFHVDVLLPDLQEVMDRLREKQAAIALPAGGQVGNDNGDERLREEIGGQLVNGAAEELARVFIRHAAFLKLYSTYITQFDTALERLREWTVTGTAAAAAAPAWTPSGTSTSGGAPGAALHHHGVTLSHGQKKRLKAYLKRCRAHSSHTQMNLESYLLMPVQRLPRYKLLLENLVSCTPEHVGFSTGPGEDEQDSGGGCEGSGDGKANGLTANKLVSEALSIVSSMTAEMNERKRDSEGRQRLLYWQQRFGNKYRSPLVQPHRTLIKEGTMTLVRIVKLTTKDGIAGGNLPGQAFGRVRVPVLSTDSQVVSMIVLLCTDLLVLVKDPGDSGRGSNTTPATLFQALRLAQHSRSSFVNLPATVFGADQTMVRFVDSRAIFYFQCNCQRDAVSWMVSINQQVPLL